MANEVLPRPSQARQDGRWLPTRHKTTPTLRSHRRSSIPLRRSSFKTVLRRKPLSTINEDKMPSVESTSSVSLRLNTNLPYQPPAKSPSSEHLVYFHPSQQLQNFQSVSLHCTDEAHDSMPQMYRTQTQWNMPSPRSYERNAPLSPESPTIYRRAASLEMVERIGSGVNSPSAGEDAPRETMAYLIDRARENEAEHPKVLRDSRRTWVRVNTVGQGLTKSFKTVGSLRCKEQSFEPRLEAGYGGDVSVQSQLRIYEKPSKVERVRVRVGDFWQTLKNWKTGRNTESLTATDCSQSSTSPQEGPCKLSRAPTLESAAIGTGTVRRRKESLFLDVYASDIAQGVAPAADK